MTIHELNLRSHFDLKRFYHLNYPILKRNPDITILQKQSFALPYEPAASIIECENPNTPSQEEMKELIEKQQMTMKIEEQM